MTGRKLCIQIGGGLGDQVCAEPIIRYYVEQWGQADDIALMTHYPEFFKHLPVTSYTQAQNFNEPRMSTQTHPDKTNDPFDKVLIFQRSHPVDYISARLLRRTLPLQCKSIRLQVDSDALTKIQTLLGNNRSKTVLIHAGEGWPSKTFSKDIWSSYCKILNDHDYNVVLIGKGSTKEILHANLDLRNQLNIEELIAIISVAPILVSNDSGPIHVAGAFDNWIGLIASCKDPSYLFPYRQGSQKYKTQSLERYKAYEQDFNFDPLNFIDIPISDLSEEKIKKLVPTPDEVLAFVRRAFSQSE